MQSRFPAVLVLLSALTLNAADVAGYAKRIAPLIDPAKLATLGERGANPRVQKFVAALAETQAAGLKPWTVAEEAVKRAGYRGEAATLTIDRMVRNLDIAKKLVRTSAKVATPEAMSSEQHLFEERPLLSRKLEIENDFAA